MKTTKDLPASLRPCNKSGIIQQERRQRVVAKAHDLRQEIDGLNGTTSEVRTALWSLRAQLNALYQRHQDR